MISIYHAVVLIYVIFVAYQSCISQTVKLVCMTAAAGSKKYIDFHDIFSFFFDWIDKQIYHFAIDKHIINL